MVEEEPKQMVEIVRMLTEKYIVWAKDDTLADRNSRIASLKQDFDNNDKELRDKQAKQINLWRTLGATDSEEVRTRKLELSNELIFARNKLADRERQLSVAEQDLARLESRQKAIDNNEIPEALLLDDVKTDPEMIELKKKIAEIHERFLHARSVAKYPNSDPAVRRLAEELAGLKESEDRLKADLRDIAIAKLKYGDDGIGENLSVTRIRVENLRTEVAAIGSEIADLKEDLLGLSRDDADLAQLSGDIKRLEAANEDLDERLREALLRLKVPPPVEVIEPAQEPEGSTVMYRLILTTFLGLLSFCVGVGSVVLFEYTKQRVSTLNEIGYGGLGLRVLGTVPNLARIAHSKNGEAAGAISGILAESIDSVRTMLLSNKQTDAPKVILVTSADEHEGKTTVASHLAASLARAGRRTLLVDGDLRKPGIHQLFDMPLSAGLCEVLRGEAEIDAVVHPAQVEGMWVMLAGQCDQRAVASLAKENCEAIFRTLRADYDFVVVDTGPALAFADTMLMGGHADAAVMAILRDVSQIPKVYEARERLEAIGVPVLGGVVGGMARSGSRAYAVLS
jgi:capsular exopolysaccharide synthesis family protein